MLRRLPLTELLAWSIRNPRAAVALARDNWLAGILLVAGVLPAGVRRPVFSTIAAAARRAGRRPGDHGLAFPLHVVAVAAARGTGAGRGALRRLEPRAGAASAAPLARLALLFEDPLLAERLVAAAPRDGLPARDARARVAFELGDYADAIAQADAVLRERPADSSLRRLRERASGEEALLDPAWRPALGSGAIQPGIPGTVLHLLTISLPQRQAGYTLRAQQVARCQARVGLVPHMATRAGFPGVEGRRRPGALEVVDGVPYHRIDPDLPPLLPTDRVATATAHGLLEIAARVRPAVLQPTTNHVNAQVALAVGDAAGIPVVYEVRGFLESTWLSRVGASGAAADRYARTRAIETACMRRAAAVVTLSETMRADILARGGITADRVVVVPNAVDVDTFRPGPRDDALAADLGIAAGETVVGYVSSFVAYEGIRFLIEAVAELRRRGRRVRLLLVGDGEDTPNLRAVAERTGLARGSGVIFTGRVPHAEIERYYRTIDIFVVPRTADQVCQLVTPLKPYEAMAMERAMVVSRVGALVEIVEDGVTGVTFAPEDTGSLADAVDRLLDDPAGRAAMGRAAREWVAANRTWAQNGARYRELFERLGVA